MGGASGGDFFTGTGAIDLAVLPTDPAGLAVSSAQGAVDGANALALGDLSIDSGAAAVLNGSPGPSALLRDLTGALGTQVQSLKRAVTVQTAVVDTADAAVESSAGVNLDEEMANLLQYQRSYQASARVITAIDEVLDTLVNRLGTVGR
jgi:flagellar hook-associated protein 1 FlgK